MRPNSVPDRSRIVATAASLGDVAPDHHCFTEKSVLLTGEPDIVATENGRNCYMNSFRLLIRMVKNLTVHVPAHQPLVAALMRECNDISVAAPPTIITGDIPEYSGFDAILSVGTKGEPGLPWTVINSHGWLARVSSKGESISGTTDQPNSISALGAAAFGTAEVFKRLIVLRPERGEALPAISFSFLTYTLSEDPGPALPDAIPIDLALFGAGAIGNGVVHLLNALPVTGFIAIIDRQAFQPENWGTCLLIGPKEFGEPKAVWAYELLRKKLRAIPIHGDVAKYAAKCGRDCPHPKLVINGLDNIPARRAVQNLWPDQVIDGAIGPTACEVTLHPWAEDYSCLLCDFEEPSQSSQKIQLRASGLRADRVNDANAFVTEEDVAAAPAEKREWLSRQLGKTVCSVVSAAVLKDLSAEEQKAGFEPSAPFVACLSACMVVTETVRHALNWPPTLQTGYQFDALVGPQHGMFKFHTRKKDCICVTRRPSIERLRNLRLVKLNPCTMTFTFVPP